MHGEGRGPRTTTVPMDRRQGGRHCRRRATHVLAVTVAPPRVPNMRCLHHTTSTALHTQPQRERDRDEEANACLVVSARPAMVHGDRVPTVNTYSVALARGRRPSLINSLSSPNTALSTSQQSSSSRRSRCYALQEVDTTPSLIF